MLIERPPEWCRRLYKGALFRIPSEEKGRKRVFITFDDGPVKGVTEPVLDILDDFGVKATFFMVGDNVRRFPGMIDEVRRRGHSVGNHTMHHVRSLSETSFSYLKDTLEAQKLTGSSLFRPPHGFLRLGHFKILKEKYCMVMYDVVTRDYSSRLSAAEVVEIVRKYARDGSIIVFHDSEKSLPRTLKALPKSLQWLKENGFSFGRISEKGEIE